MLSLELSPVATSTLSPTWNLMLGSGVGVGAPVGVGVDTGVGVGTLPMLKVNVVVLESPPVAVAVIVTV